METFEQSARDAATPAPSIDESLVCPSKSTASGFNGSAGTAPGKAANSTTRTIAETWAKDVRGLSPATLELLDVDCDAEQFFPDLKRRSPALTFRYGAGWKARAVPDKAFVAGKGFELAFWNQESVLRGVKARRVSRVYVVEGELDACALVEAGVSHEAVLSVPNGAKQRPNDEPASAKAYAYVDAALAAGLNRADAIVWCGDDDAPGLALRTDMVSLFGPAKFWFVDWDGLKDAGDVLIKRGAASLLDRVANGAQPWPVEGLYRISQLPEPPALTLWDPGFAEWESKVRLAPRTLSVVTGHPGHGKTALWCQIWFNVAKKHDVTICAASFETRPKPHMRRQLRSLFCGALERDLQPDEIRAADAWIEAHYLFLVHPDQRPTLDWLLTTAEVAVVRHGARVVQVDPWNRLEGARGPRESETDYIGRCLRALHGFAHDLNIHVQILAHPAKMEGNRRGQPPSLEDISGSKHWDNSVDQGFVVHRPEIFDGSTRKTEAVLYQRKARFEELGHPCKMLLDYSLSKGRYLSTDYAGVRP